LCLNSGYFFVFAGSQQWQDYTLQFDLKIRTPRPTLGESALALVRVTVPEPAYAALFHFNAETSLYKLHRDRKADPDQLLRSSSQIWVDQLWHTVQIQAFGPIIRVLIDDDIVINVTDEDNHWQQGGIALGVAPSAEVCYDKVSVFALDSNPSQ
jgi:hypothetical protein